MKPHLTQAKGHHHKKGKRRTHRRMPPGTPPGTLMPVDLAAPHPLIRLMAYGPEEMIEQEVRNPRDVRAVLGQWPVMWVHVEGLGDIETIRTLGEIFALHGLALEDVIDVHQRPKVEEYGQYLYLVARMAVAGDQLETDQFSLFLSPHFVLSFDEHPGDCFDPVRERIRHKRGRMRDAGADYLAYALLDAIVDAYFPILEEYGERLDMLEDEVVAQPDHNIVARIHEVKRDLLTLRRAIWPQREAMNVLLRDITPLITDETRVYLRDCYDHTVQLMDLVETYRELGADLMDVYLSSVSNRTNEVMRVLTVIAVIFIPLTFIAGVYGMNFNPETSPWNMPELNWYWGYPFSLALMALIVIGQLAFFWRRGWLGMPRVLHRVVRIKPDTDGSGERA
jgi:magnesium transporter